MSLVISVDDGMTPVCMVIIMSVMLLIVWEEPAYYLLSDLSAAPHGLSLSADNVGCSFGN